MKKLILPILGAAMFIAQAGAQTITGAGSTFDYPAFTKWFEAYGKVDANVQFNYQSIGSGGGIKNLINQTVDFGASDAPMKDEALASAPGKILHIPIVAGGVAVIYNLPGSPKLKLDGDTLAGIYLGNITKWNDPKIAALNPGVDLPDTAIIPVHRADGSGTSFIFTDYLGSVNPAWADTVGKGSSVKWPAGIGLAAKGSEGVAGQVKQLPGGIGYAELAYADQNKIPFADLKNSSGNFISPAPGLRQRRARHGEKFQTTSVSRWSTRPAQMPIRFPAQAGCSVYQKSKNAVNGPKLVAFLKWAVTEGQKISPSLDYAPLPDEVQQRELKLLGTVH